MQGTCGVYGACKRGKGGGALAGGGLRGEQDGVARNPTLCQASPVEHQHRQRRPEYNPKRSNVLLLLLFLLLIYDVEPG